MLPIAVVEEIRRLVAEGRLSQRQIAQQVGVSRGTVGAVANGRRGLHGQGPKRRHPTSSRLEMPAERCCGCGGKVYKPCLLCQTRAYRQRNKRLMVIGMTEVSRQRQVA